MERNLSSPFISKTPKYTCYHVKKRICVYCDLNDIDDKLNHLLKCSCLNDLRQTVIQNIFRVQVLCLN